MIMATYIGCMPNAICGSSLLGYVGVLPQGSEIDLVGMDVCLLLF